MPKRLFMRQLAIFCSLIIYLLVVALVLAALITEFWVETQQLKRNNEESPLSYVNSGLFSGLRQLDWGLGPRRQYFSGIFDYGINL
jgi:predicted PurR-regulated permease PerM